MEEIIKKKKKQEQQQALLTLKDVEHLVVKPNATSLDILAAVAAVAQRLNQFPNNYHAPTTLQRSQPQRPPQQHILCPKKLSLPPKESPRPICSPSLFGVGFKSWTWNYKRPSTSCFKKGKQVQEPSYSDEDEDEDDEDEDDYCMQRRQSDDSCKVVKRKRRDDAYGEDGDEEKPQTKKKKIKGSGRMRPVAPINPEQYMPSDLKTLILETKRGRELKLVVQKKLTKSDIRTDFGRFLIPRGQTVHPFLEESETEMLKTEFIEVNIIEPNNNWRESRIKLRRWEMKNEVYVLNGHWNSLVMENGLAPGMLIQLWSFRVDDKLSFAMVNLSHSQNTTPAAAAAASASPPVAPLPLLHAQSMLAATLTPNNNTTSTSSPTLDTSNPHSQQPSVD